MDKEVNLMLACQTNDTAKLQTFLNKSNINQQPHWKMSLLHFAVLANSPQVVEILLEKGIDIKLKDDTGNQAI